MKKLSFIVAIAAMLMIARQGLAQPAQNLFSWIKKPYSWEEVQRMGGLALGAPSRSRQGLVSVPVFCDLKGAGTAIDKPLAVNSAFVLRDIAVRVAGKQIFISLFAVLDHSKGSATSWKAELGNIKPGAYEVIYSANGKLMPMAALIINGD